MSETREKSVKKPADHKRAKTETVTVEYGGVEFEVQTGAMGRLRVLDALERSQFMTALRLMVGDAKVDEFLVKNEEADADDAGKLLELIAERAGTKN